MNQYLDIHPEVASAIAANKPVVALESTIITHGMPFPQNVTTALQVEDIVREAGAVPATIAIIDGRLKAGLTNGEIAHLGELGHAVEKASRRDLGMMIASKRNGATTVATTMIIAHMAGIRVFATGGIGGVHRGASESMDISADLQELAKTPVAVVCAGIKAILDLGLTREYLETHGVPLIGYQTDMLPAFYSRESNFGVDYKLDAPADIAKLIAVQQEIGFTNGMVIANPIPEAYSMELGHINQAIDQALADMDEAGVKGKDQTPFLLSRVEQLTGGDSLAANIQLVFNNARLAGEIASQLAKS